MKMLFDSVSEKCSKLVTLSYSTSFSMATKTLGLSIRNHIFNIYSFVRFADEIVDTFHNYSKKNLLDRFELDLYHALEHQISLNPILNSFQITVNKYNIDHSLINSFLKSMRWDLQKKTYESNEEYNEYIYGSADVVGLMCLKVFVNGNELEFKKLSPYAIALGSAFQKVNFLRDLKNDFEKLDRSYFPGIDFKNFDEASKSRLISEINHNFKTALIGIKLLPKSSRLGVYTAYKYYLKLLVKLKNTPSQKIATSRIRVPNYQKIIILLVSYLKHQLKII
jgi:phytoene synthase